MTEIISVPTFISNYGDDDWDDIEFPDTGLLLVNNNELSTTTRDMSGIQDSSDDDSEEDDYFGKRVSHESTPASSASSSIYKVKELMINNGVVITNNKEGLMITRLGGGNNKVIAVGDDWDDDMEMPEDGFANLTINKKNRSRSSTVSFTNDFEFDSWDEEEQSTTTRESINLPRELIIKRIKDPSEVLSSTALESFDDDFDFSGKDSSKLDFTAESLKSHQGLDYSNIKDPFGSESYSSKNSSRLSVSINGSPSAHESGEEEDSFDDIEFPEHMDSLTLIAHNDDDDDFENGLDIGNESAFDLKLLKNKNIITRSNPNQHKRTRRESFSIEFNPSLKNNLSSSISLASSSKVHPKTTSNSPSSVPSPKINKASSKSLKVPTTVKNTSKSIFPISRSKSPLKLPIRRLVKKQVSMNNISLNTDSTSKLSSNTNNLTSSNKHIKSTPKTNSTPKNRTLNNTFNTPNSNPNSNPNSVLEVMREPKGQQSFGDGTELDGFDDLPTNIDRERLHTRDRSNSASSVYSKIDNSNSHRKHRKHRRRRKPQLIRNISANKNPKVVGDMVYNQITHRWDGNDSILKDFDNVLTSPIRPALISNMNNRARNTKSFQMVGKMKFDPIKMCWYNDSSDNEEIWARFDDDDDDDQNPPSQAGDNDTPSNNIKSESDQIENINSNDFQVGSEFDITPGFKAALLASERQHRNEITRWYPDALSKNNDSIFGFGDTTSQKSHLYDLRNNKNNRNVNNSSSGNNSKIYHNRTCGLFEAAKGLTRHERRHFHDQRTILNK